MTTSNDFLTQIQTTEAKAQKAVQEAKAKQQSDLQKYESKLADARTKTLGASREEVKQSLKEKQVEMKDFYEQMKREGNKEAQKLEREVEPKLDKVLVGAQMYLLNDLLAA
jgi:vacuolar-type H+-ATPase subunit H